MSDIIVLTPKGIICCEAGIEQGERIWNGLIRAAKQSVDFEEKRGIPAIILDTVGGHFEAVKVQ